MSKALEALERLAEMEKKYAVLEATHNVTTFFHDKQALQSKENSEMMRATVLEMKETIFASIDKGSDISGHTMDKLGTVITKVLLPPLPLHHFLLPLPPFFRLHS